MTTAPDDAAKGGFLGAVERVGNMVPHPAIIFFLLIGIVIVLSVIFGLLGTTVTYDGYDVAIGDIVALMPPCTVVLLVTWTLLLVVWYALGFPLGPA